MALDFAAGCLGGCAGLVVGYPLDTIKVHIQTQDSRNLRFRGTWHCFKSILATESLSGLYRGISSPMAGVGLVNALVFGAYGKAQRQFSDPDQFSSHFLAGAAAGLAQAPVASPLELAKTRMQLQSSESLIKYRGPLHCLKEIWRKRGVAGVFNGLGITAMREGPAYGIYFMTYEALTRSESPASISTCTMLIAGGVAGTTSWIFTYPIDVVKSRLQADISQKYLSTVDCLKKSIRDEGYSCLFRGLNSTILRAFPTNAATFVVVHWTLRLFESDEIQKKVENQVQSVTVVPGSPEIVGDHWNSFVSLWNGNAYANSIVLAITRSETTTVSEEARGKAIVEPDT